MLVLTRKNRESVVIGRPEDMSVALQITVLDIEGGRVRLGFEADTRMPIHRREVWDRICNGQGHGESNGEAAAAAAAAAAATAAAAAAGMASRTGDGQRREG